MIFRRVLLRELVIAALAVFSVLLVITLTTLLIRFLGEAASGTLASEAIAAFLGFSLLNYLPVLLSLTVFIAVLITLTRWYRDSEMVAWFSAGMSLTAWIRPVLYFSLPLVLVIALLSMSLSPWALRKGEEYTRQIESRDDVATVAPGVFKESRQADRVYFVENFSGEQGSAANIFMQAVQHQTLGVMAARQGYQEQLPNGDHFLVLLNGRRYEGKPGAADYKILQFERYAMRIEPYESKLAAPSTKSLRSADLMRDRTPDKMGEWVWRVGLPVSALILALLAIPLSFVNPRAGRSFNLILALLAYMVYNNLISVSQVWVAQQKIGFMMGLLSVHLIMLALLAVFFKRRLAVVPLISWKR
jgi:lipopolysaccharide export system permease protein